MKKIFVSLLLIFTAMNANAQNFACDTIPLKTGDLKMHFIKHASIYFDYNGYLIYIDPVSMFADYSQLPKADLILLTHEHYDHYDIKAVKALLKKQTIIVANANVSDSLKKEKVKNKLFTLKNGESTTVHGMLIEAKPAYNTTPANTKFHPKGRDNGYVLNIDNKRVYVAGDCENMPEMAQIKNIDIAFLPMNQPYTMQPYQVFIAVKMFEPKILYPYHYGETNVDGLLRIMRQSPTEVRVRDLQ